MPEHIRSLIIILLIAVPLLSFWSARIKPALSEPSQIKIIVRIWLLLTITAFLSPSFWIYVVVASAVLIFSVRKIKNPIAIFLSLLYALPIATTEIPGMGLINYLFSLSHQRLLALLILLPAYFALRNTGKTHSTDFKTADKLLILFIALKVVLSFRMTSSTDVMRQAFYAFVDIYLPYIVLSRYLITYEKLKDAIVFYIIPLFVLAAIALFESLKHWILYSPMLAHMQISEGMLTSYLSRGGALRAVATSGQAIPLGYLMTVAFGLYLFVRRFLPGKFARLSGAIILGAGLIAPLSRGPWVGFSVLLVLFHATGKHALKKISYLILFSALGLFLLMAMPGGEKVVNLLPFIGSTEKANIDYRDKLLDNSLKVIDRNFWLGSTNYLDTPEMQEMIQGQGIIDIVNTYVAMALDYGVIGLTLFCVFFLSILLNLYYCLRKTRDKHQELHLLGRVLFSVLAAILVMIFTVSSITIIPITYWSIAGICVAYINIVRRTEKGAGNRNY